MRKNPLFVKVCGMRDAENIREVEALGIDMMGFIFYRKSPRCVEEVPAYLPTSVKRVGVFVNADEDEIREKAKVFRFDYIQLHGNETPETCQRLKDESYSVIKAFQIADSTDFLQTIPYEKSCRYFLFDTKSKQYGGTGAVFDWNILSEYKGTVPFILSGGIGPESVDSLKTFAHPLCAGIDLNSKFEVQPALKNIKILKNFLNRLYQ